MQLSLGRLAALTAVAVAVSAAPALAGARE